MEPTLSLKSTGVFLQIQYCRQFLQTLYVENKGPVGQHNEQNQGLNYSLLVNSCSGLIEVPWWSGRGPGVSYLRETNEISTPGPRPDPPQNFKSAGTHVTNREYGVYMLEQSSWIGLMGGFLILVLAPEDRSPVLIFVDLCSICQAGAVGVPGPTLAGSRPKTDRN